MVYIGSWIKCRGLIFVPIQLASWTNCLNWCLWSHWTNYRYNVQLGLILYFFFFLLLRRICYFSLIMFFTFWFVEWWLFDSFFIGECNCNMLILFLTMVFFCYRELHKNLNGLFWCNHYVMILQTLLKYYPCSGIEFRFSCFVDSDKMVRCGVRPNGFHVW